MRCVVQFSPQRIHGRLLRVGLSSLHGVPVRFGFWIVLIVWLRYALVCTVMRFVELTWNRGKCMRDEVDRHGLRVAVVVDRERIFWKLTI